MRSTRVSDARGGGRSRPQARAGPGARALTRSGALSAAAMLQLQRSAGNRRVLARLVDPREPGALGAEDVRDAVAHFKLHRYAADLCRRVQTAVGVEADGVFGPITARAVAAWQEREGLEPDGKVGPATLRALGLAAPRPDGAAEAGRDEDAIEAGAAQDEAPARADGADVAVSPEPAVEALELAPKAKLIATALKKEFPSITFTSGRRDDVEEQARAMAGNVVRNREWIGQTYRDRTLVARLEGWLEQHPEATTKAEITAGFVDVMAGWTDAEKGRLSAHFSGEAFDIRPQTENAAEVKAEAYALAKAHGGKFLEKEGGLIRWHLQCRG